MSEQIFLIFELNCDETGPGDSIYVGGGIKELRNGDKNKSLKLIPFTFHIRKKN